VRVTQHIKLCLGHCTKYYFFSTTQVTMEAFVKKTIGEYAVAVFSKSYCPYVMIVFFFNIILLVVNNEQVLFKGEAVVQLSWSKGP
jgi:hypothetical protein